MTEAMSRHEIEDVLSSIRRLVSHEGHTATPAASGPGKLVLTSALRVDAPQRSTPTDMAAEGAAPRDATAQETVPERRAPEGDTADNVPEAAPESGLSFGAELSHRDTAPHILNSAPVAQGRPSLLARIASAGQVSDTETGAVTASLQRSAAGQTPAAPPDPSLQGAVTDSALEATLARLEEALSITPPPADGEADTIIDEDALTQIVAKIVRQELQGELGERITRNIRKLVRAEVARELQMRNL